MKTDTTAKRTPFLPGDQLVADFVELGIELHPDALLLATMQGDCQQSLQKPIALGANHGVSIESGMTTMTMALSSRGDELVEMCCSTVRRLKVEPKNGLRIVHFVALGNRSKLTERVDTLEIRSMATCNVCNSL